MRKIQYILIIFSLLLLPLLTLNAGIVVRPQYLFVDAPAKSGVLTISNSGEQTIEVTIDLKYGYHTTDDSANIVVVMPDQLQQDDRSMVNWIRAYPSRFILGPSESQGVRIFANPPSGMTPGEYWAKMIVTPHVSKTVEQKNKKGPAIENRAPLFTSFIFGDVCVAKHIELFGGSTASIQIRKTHAE